MSRYRNGWLACAAVLAGMGLGVSSARAGQMLYCPEDYKSLGDFGIKGQNKYIFDIKADLPILRSDDGKTVLYTGEFVGRGPRGGGVAVFSFDTIDLAAGQVIEARDRISGDNSSLTPLILLARGAVNIAGSIDARGRNGGDGGTVGMPPNNEKPPNFTLGGSGSAGGRDGGNGGATGQNGTDGRDTGGGKGGKETGGGGGGGGFGGAGGAAGTNGGGEGGAGGEAYGDLEKKIEGGSGGGGGAGGGLGMINDGNGGGGGGGGGAVAIISNKTIDIKGSIDVRGGNGGAGDSAKLLAGFGGGGGGSGGAIYLYASGVAVAAAAVLDARGGDGGAAGSAAKAAAGGGGGAGRVLITTIKDGFKGIENNTNIKLDGGLKGGDGASDGSSSTILFTTDFAPCPEPSTIATAIMGGAMMAWQVRRKRSS